MTRKTITTIYIEAHLVEEAKRRGINLSGFVNNKLSESLSDIRKGEFLRAEELEKQLKAEIAIFLQDVGKKKYHKYIDARLEMINSKLGTGYTRIDFHAAIIDFKEKQKEAEKNGKSNAG